MKKSYMKALVVATTLAIPFATYSTPALAALKAEANQSVAAVSDRTYDTEIKIYKDQKDEPSMVSQFIKNPKVAVVDGKKIVTVTVQDSDYFQYLRIEDQNQPKIFHDVKVLSEDKRKNGTKVVQFEIGDFDKKYNMQMHILIPDISYNNKYQVQLEIKDPTLGDKEKEKINGNSNLGNMETGNQVDSQNMITDKKLRELVNKKVFKREDLNTPITKEELLQVNNLFLNTNEILDYSALKYMPNLKSLTVANAKIKDPSFFANLKQLNHLALRGNEFSDVTPLVKMDNLESLDLSNNKITNVAPLTKMKNVKTLFLSGNQIEDVTALAKMEQLDYLNLANNKIKNVAPLSALKNVTYLTLAGNQVEDIKPLYSLPLKDLVLTRNNVKDLSGIDQMNQLNILFVGKNQIKDVTPLAKMTQLTELDLPHNELKDITPLSNLVNLQKLDLEANYISDLSPVSNLKKLVYLSFVANEIRDVRPVIELSKRAYIKVQNQKVFLEETEVNKEVKVPIYEKDGEVSTKIRLKSDNGTYSNGVVKWSTPGEKVYEFGVKDPYADTGIFFTGSVIQNVVESKEDNTPKEDSTSKEEEKIEVVGFKDVPKGHWSEEAINHLTKENIFKGYGNGQFGFGDNITRGQVASLIQRYLKLENKVNEKELFTDTKGHMFEQDIATVAQAGIMKGDGTGEFRPDGILTRYEMSVVLQRVFQLKENENSTENFKDIPNGHWAKGYVKALVDNKISKGDGEGNFLGNNFVTREQYAQFLYNAITKS
ncbi:NEAT domain-containing leucine-rich repeat protein [Bacillus thuringiensis]|uniref:NEAT domain-containing leucine-rich repeat protein n=1 Tax=Bacillus thuringiensis TaxID=1428 RepID=UPI0011AB56BF|nr:NEAT domain-containing leucine-rich repeat protein [Bacillus thuringiensis]MDR4149181.1 NEAT domain-containing leucine-rich repeat protein [Bacillus thuringiensis]MEC3574274.1 NEAT domain-containing leucine-rich repeat protein [Bacillus thuringiensis]MED2017900.1 NEAT domain-containing leucine-rich repeat protein [Bacillus thuringiensis]MED2145103.1 NEAT domain-containing leucine-rich repeat protein [Bacillus thuringiensis]MED2521583.1 NEAT domain-containing leucine-rich repeat protein [Bac